MHSQICITRIIKLRIDLLPIDGSSEIEFPSLATRILSNRKEGEGKRRISVSSPEFMIWEKKLALWSIIEGQVDDFLRWMWISMEAFEVFDICICFTKATGTVGIVSQVNDKVVLRERRTSFRESVVQLFEVVRIGGIRKRNEYQDDAERFEIDLVDSR